MSFQNTKFKFLAEQTNLVQILTTLSTFGHSHKLVGGIKSEISNWANTVEHKVVARRHAAAEYLCSSKTVNRIYCYSHVNKFRSIPIKMMKIINVISFLSLDPIIIAPSS